MTDILIRKYLPTDNPQLKELYRIASLDSEVGYRPGPWEKDFEDIEEHYFNGGDFLVGEIDGKIVAMGGLERIEENIGHIRRMRVHPDHRRKGFAQMIIAGLEQSAKSQGIKELRLRTSTLQKMAQNFYEKNGFTRINNQKKEFYTEGPFEVIWYQKYL